MQTDHFFVHQYQAPFIFRRSHYVNRSMQKKKKKKKKKRNLVENYWLIFFSDK